LSPSEGGTGVAFPAAAVGGQMGSIAFGIVANDSYVTGVLTALAQKGLSKILSNPKVTTINNKEAKILVGQRIPYTTTTVSTAGSTQATQFLDVGIKLTVTPTINIDQKITLQVHPEVSLFVRSDPAGPVIGTREALTTVLINNGETVVIGGLITEEDRKLGTQVPLLGDLPIIGHLFKRDYNTKDRTELLVFLTPQILNN
jgi:type II secretory pathway component GspD/PulD (secretin)